MRSSKGAELSPQASRSHPARASATALISRDELPWLAVAVLTAVGLRVLWVTYVNVDPFDGRFDDSVFYHRVGDLLARGVGYDDPYARGTTAQWPPAYPATLALLYKLFGLHLLLAKGLNIALAAVTVVLTYVVARRIFDRRVAYLGALLLAFFPGQIFFSTLVWAETMFGMVFVLVLLLALVWTVERQEARWWQVLLLGFVVGVAGMVRSEGVFLAFVLGALWALTVRPWRTAARYAALAVLGIALALTPWTVRNAIEFHEFIPLRSGVTVFLTVALDPDAEVPRPAEQRSIDEGLRYQLTHPWQAVSYAREKASAFFRSDSEGIRLILNNRAPPDDQPLTPDEQRGWRALADLYFLAVGAAALVGAAVSLLRRDRAGLVLILAVLAWALLFSFVRPVPRYHFALGPVFSILAGGFLIFVWDWAGLGWRRWILQAKGARADLEISPTEAAAPRAR